jgi:hypothetical protein
MAVVRFSAELQSAVVDNAKFSTRINAAYKATPPIAEEVADLVYAQFVPAINALPKDFLQWSNRVEIRVPYNTSKIEVTYETKREFVKPQHRIKLDDGAIIDSMFAINLKLPDGPKYQQYIDQIIAWHENVKALEKQRDDFVSGVKQVVNAHATLAPALKAWPPLWDLVPETFRERHRKVVERAKAAPVTELDVDLTKLTTTVVAAKIAGK